MSRYWLATLGFAAIASMTDASIAQKVDMKWGLENTWSYYELVQGRADDEDAATHRPKSTARPPSTSASYSPSRA